MISSGPKRNHRRFAGARSKRSSRPPRLRKRRRACRPASTARRSSMTIRTASELLRDWRASRSRRTFPVSSKRCVRINAVRCMNRFSTACRFTHNYTREETWHLSVGRKVQGGGIGTALAWLIREHGFGTSGFGLKEMGVQSSGVMPSGLFAPTHRTSKPGLMSGSSR